MLSAELIALNEARRDAVTLRIERLGTIYWDWCTLPLEQIDWRALRAFATDAARGKALFLDIMGFAHERTMAGDPGAERRDVTRSYDGRLRPRHHALARLGARRRRAGDCDHELRPLD